MKRAISWNELKSIVDDFVIKNGKSSSGFNVGDITIKLHHKTNDSYLQILSAGKSEMHAHFFDRSVKSASSDMEDKIKDGKVLVYKNVSKQINTFGNTLGQNQ